MHQITVGRYTITALSDGLSRLPPLFFPGLDCCSHASGIDPDGTIHIPTGCFLVHGADRTVLVDAGLGPLRLPYPEGMPAATAPEGQPTPYLSEGGQLPDQLRGLGCDPSGIDTVVLTHLHPDHIGWIAPHGIPYFPRAQILCGAADWDTLIEPSNDTEPGISGMRTARDTHRLTVIDTTTHKIAPGITMEHTPGHTPGSYILVIGSARQRAYLLGDVVQHPLQLNNTTISFLTDTDRAQAERTRSTLLHRLERDHNPIGTAHFPGSDFHRIIPGTPRIWKPEH